MSSEPQTALEYLQSVEQADRHAAVISALRDYLASLGVPDEPAEVILESFAELLTVPALR